MMSYFGGRLSSMLAAGVVALASVVSHAIAQTSLIPADPIGTYAYYDGVPGGSAARIAVTGQSFTSGVRISTAATGAHVYDAQLAWNTMGPVVQGDLLLLTFWVRRVSPLDGRTIDAQVVFERNGGDYVHSLSCSFPNETNQWQRYAVAFRAAATHAAGEARIAFQFSIGPQSFDIGGVSAFNYGPNVAPASLPTAFYYPGRDANAPWRAQAEARIAAYRKGNFNIRVLDCNGGINPVANATIHVSQTNHAFKFGTALAADVLVGTGNDTYRSTFLSNFNSAVIENHLKWPFWEAWASTDGLAALNWLSQRSISTRGHNLIWPTFGYMPSDCDSLSATNLRSRIDTHFTQILNATRGKLFEWDVINEPYTSSDVMGHIPGVAGVPADTGTLGNAEMIRWFQEARAADNSIGLVLNDYNVLEGVEPTHRAYTAALIQWLLQQGAPVTRLGLQAHFGNAIIPIPELEARIATLSALPVRLSVTEFDVDTLDETLQADYTRDVLTEVFSQPRFDGFYMWGFWEGAHWIPNAAMYRMDWSAKLAAAAWHNQIYSIWHTDTTGPVDSGGRFATQAFYGDYRVDVTVPGVIGTSTSFVSFTASGQVVNVYANGGIARQPASTTTCAGGAASFSVVPAGSGTYSFRWQTKRPGGSWAAMADGVFSNLGTVSGANGATLTISNANAAGSLFRCVVISGASCGSTTTVVSGEAGLTLCACLVCPADFNQDGGVDGADIAAFFARWEAGNCDADVNQDGGVDAGDIETFFTAWEAGGC
jgi:GH35 family endo-1,4-beta-xylanase